MPMVRDDTDIILQNKKKEERKRLLLKLLTNERFDIIRQIESLRIPHTCLWLTVSDPAHKKWLEEFTVIFDEHWDDELIEISVDQVDIFTNDEWEILIKFDFDDILENEWFNIWLTIPFDNTVNENWHFDINLFQEHLKLCLEKVIHLMQNWSSEI